MTQLKAALLVDIISRSRRYGRRELLMAISKASSTLFDKPGRVHSFTFQRQVGSFSIREMSHLSTHGLTALTRIVLAHGNQWKSNEPTVNQLVLLENRIQNLPSFFTTKPVTDSMVDELLFQLSFQQFPFQSHGERAAFGRTLVLYRDIPRILRDEGFGPSLDLEGAFMDLWGMSLLQFMVTGFVIASQALANPAIRVSELRRFMSEELPTRWSGSAVDMPTPERCDQVLAAVALDYDGFKERIGDVRSQDDRLAGVDFWPLPAFPIVKTGPDEIVVPIVKLLMDRLATGVFHDLSGYYARPGVDNAFRTYFGALFERYVGYQLELVFKKESLVPETPYGPSGSQSSTPDWTINTRTNPTAIECRSSTFTLDTRKYADLNLIHKELARIGTNTLQRAVQKKEDLEKGRTPIRLLGSDGIRLGLCTWEFLQPLGLFGALLDKELESAGTPGLQFHLVPLTYLESICAHKDPNLYVAAMDILTVSPSWRIPAAEGPEKELERLIPGPWALNPIVDAAAQEVFGPLF